MNPIRNQKKQKRGSQNPHISSGVNKNYWIFKKNQWFFEATVPGILDTIKTGLRIKKRIFAVKSPYQRLEVIDTFPFGRILVLDGIIQLSQVDEFIYHEMLTHPAIFSHLAAKRVLIIGGGDGGALREVLRHPIQEVYLVDIDKKVIEVSQKYLPFVSRGAFLDKRAKIFIEDGIKFIKKYKNFFDVIIIDSTDPLGPSLPLFSKNFYQDIFKALTKNGVLSVQSGCLFEQFFHLKKIFEKLKNFFPFIKIHKACVPCLQCSNEYSFTVASKFDLRKITLKDLEKKFKKLNPVRDYKVKVRAQRKQISNGANLGLKYYSPEIHFSSVVLPRYLKQSLKIK